MALKTEVDYLWKLRDDKRASKYAYVFYDVRARNPWRAIKKGVFSRYFNIEEEAGKFVAQQLNCTLSAITMPEWDESMRSKEVIHYIPKRPKAKSKPILAKFRPRVLKVRFVKPPQREERVFDANDLQTGCVESDADGYEEMYGN